MDAWDINIICQVTQCRAQDVRASEVDMYLAVPVVKLAQFGKGGRIWEVDAAGQRLPDHQQPPENSREYWIVSFIWFCRFFAVYATSLLQTISRVAFPILFHLVCDIISIPPGTADIERKFSKASDLVTRKWSSLSPKRIREIMCLKSWSEGGFWDMEKFWAGRPVRK